MRPCPATQSGPSESAVQLFAFPSARRIQFESGEHERPVGRRAAQSSTSARRLARRPAAPTAAAAANQPDSSARFEFDGADGADEGSHAAIAFASPGAVTRRHDRRLDGRRRNDPFGQPAVRPSSRTTTTTAKLRTRIGRPGCVQTFTSFVRLDQQSQQRRRWRRRRRRRRKQQRRRAGRDQHQGIGGPDLCRAEALQHPAGHFRPAGPVPVAGDAVRSATQPETLVQAQVRPRDIPQNVEMAPRAGIPAHVRPTLGR